MLQADECMKHKRAFLSGLCGKALLRGLQAGPVDLAVASVAAGYAAAGAPSPLMRSIPVRSLSEILGTRLVDVRLTVQAYEDGQLPREQALVLLSLLQLAQPRVVLEIGTLHGHTTRAMAANLPGSLIHTIDLPIDFVPSAVNEPLPKDDLHLIAQRKVGQAFYSADVAPRIVQHFGDTATWDFAAAADATFFFIDGSHTYEYCKNDSEKCFELCRGKGVFLWHDCDDGHPGVLRLVSEWRRLGRDVVRIENTPLGYWSSL